MPIIVPIGTSTVAGTGVVTYSGLVSTLGDWLNRGDTDFTSQIPNFVTLLEAELNRTLRVPEMEESAEITVTDSSATLPTDLREIRHLYWNGDIDNEIVPVPLSTIRRDYPLGSFTDRPLVYAVRGGDIELAPLPGDIDGTLTVLYYEEIPALSADNESNWLIAAHPDIYLFGSLTMAEAFLWNDERVGQWRGAYENAVEQLKAQGVSKHHGGGPLFPRPIPRPGAVS